MSAGAPRVSVVLPVRNGLPYLPETLATVLGQRMRDLELVAVDDGSSDGTSETLRDASAADPRVRVVRLEGKGLATALNAGIAAARAPLIARMDADDLCAADRLGRQADFLDAHPDVGVCGSWIRVFEEGRPDKLHGYPVTHDEILASLPFESPFCHPSTMIRRSVLGESFRYDAAYTYSDDYDLWSRLAFRCRLANIPEPLLSYRRHSGQLTSTRKAEVRDLERRRVQEPLLARLGVALSDADWAVHSRVGAWQAPEDLTSAARWMERLGEANRSRAAYPEPGFSAQLSARWYHACRQAAAARGVGAWRAFRSAPRIAAGTGLLAKLKLAARCTVARERAPR